MNIFLSMYIFKTQYLQRLHKFYCFFKNKNQRLPTKNAFFNNRLSKNRHYKIIFKITCSLCSMYFMKIKLLNKNEIISILLFSGVTTLLYNSPLKVRHKGARSVPKNFDPCPM